MNTDLNTMVRESHANVTSAFERLERRNLAAETLDQIGEWAAYLLINLGLARATTIPRYVSVVGGFLLWAQAEEIKPGDVTTQDIIRWQQWLFMERRNGGVWRQTQLVAVRRFYDWLMGAASPADKVPVPRTATKLPKKYSADQLQKLFAVCDPNTTYGLRDLAILLFLYATGARGGEAVAVSIDDLVTKGNTGRVQFFGKGAKERQVGMEGPVVKVLNRWLIERDKLSCQDAALFPSIAQGRGGAGTRMGIRALDAMLARRARAAKLRDFGIHRFRVTFATDLYDDGIGLETIRLLMGHDSIETTRRYVQISERKMRTRMTARRQKNLLSPKHEHLPLWLQKKMGTLEGTQKNDD